MPAEMMTMRDLVLWTWVVGGTPLALVLCRRAVDWCLDAISAATMVRTSAVRERSLSDSGIWWKHA